MTTPIGRSRRRKLRSVDVTPAGRDGARLNLLASWSAAQQRARSPGTSSASGKLRGWQTQRRRSKQGRRPNRNLLPSKGEGSKRRSKRYRAGPPHAANAGVKHAAPSAQQLALKAPIQPCISSPTGIIAVFERSILGILTKRMDR